MLWEVELFPVGADLERQRVASELDLLTHGSNGASLILRAGRGYLLEGELERGHIETLVTELLFDPLVERYRLRALDGTETEPIEASLTVLPKPGVMDPVALSVQEAAAQLQLPPLEARTFRRYRVTQSGLRHLLLPKVLCNEAIEQLVIGPVSASHLNAGGKYAFSKVTVPLISLNDHALSELSRTGQLALDLKEMEAIQAHFRDLGRDPTDIELETIAQTWSEHCSHKTLKGQVSLGSKQYESLLKETIFAATEELRQTWGENDWCVSVFEDNAGVVKFDEQFHVCFKVETHNHPSAIEPYGGANTGLGGVIRDPLGTCLGARPICNTDVFCFAPLDTLPESLPPGVLHPMKVMRGVVAGVRDYGNRIGIPTVNGAVLFDDRYLGNPLVFCGTVGLIPVDRVKKGAQPGDLIVAVGGRTGRDGIHGATFSSIELTANSEALSGGAVQIGNPIAEKKLIDVLLQARDQGLYNAITDCGAGGFSSAIGEMGEKLGATVDLEKAPLKYSGLTYTEIWISESQERMVLAASKETWPALESLCASEDVESTVIGRFEENGKLCLRYEGETVGELSMEFLHRGRPRLVRQAVLPDALPRTAPMDKPADYGAVLLGLLASPNIASKEWIIRRYDHEVQGGTIIKPLVGKRDDGPSDAAVIAPVIGSNRGIALGCGINPRLGDVDAYAMAECAIDEAVRNIVSVGADPKRIALLDNFCWANAARPEVLGSLVSAAEACRRTATAYQMPFVSGKDSLNNEFHYGDRHILIPPTLLISAMGIVPDVRRCITMDLKEAGNVLYHLGEIRGGLAGSHYHHSRGIVADAPPRIDLKLAPVIFAKLYEAIGSGLVRACHDISDGGLAVSIAEMAFAGEVGADIFLDGDEELALFSEAPTRFILEARPEQAAAIEKVFETVPFRRLGKTVREQRLRIAGANGEWIVWSKLADLKAAWRKLSESLSS